MLGKDNVRYIEELYRDNQLEKAAEVIVKLKMEETIRWSNQRKVIQVYGSQVLFNRGWIVIIPDGSLPEDESCCGCFACAGGGVCCCCTILSGGNCLDIGYDCCGGCANEGATCCVDSCDCL